MIYYFFHFSLFSFVFCFFSRCASLLWSLVYDPVALPRRGVEVLEPTVEKTDELGLVPIFKKNKKSVIFNFFLRFLYKHYFKAMKYIEK